MESLFRLARYPQDERGEIDPTGSHDFSGAPRDLPDLLEPSDHPAVRPYEEALVADGIPAASFQVDDLDAEFGKLKAGGVAFTQEPMDAGPVRMAVFDDTCGNLIQLVQMTGEQK